MVGYDDRKIAQNRKGVKGHIRGKLPPQIVLIFLAKNTDFGLKYCIPEEEDKNTLSGETVEKVPKSRFDVS